MEKEAETETNGGGVCGWERDRREGGKELGKMLRINVPCFVAQSCPTLCNLMDCSLSGSCPWDSPGKNTGVGCHALLQGIFLTQGSNPGLLHCRWILYCLSHQLPKTPGNSLAVQWLGLHSFTAKGPGSTPGLGN